MLWEEEGVEQKNVFCSAPWMSLTVFLITSI
jgi:hypothetical protein